MLTVRTRRFDPVDAVVTMQPMRGSENSISALVILRMPPPSDERFLDPALMRHALLDDTLPPDRRHPRPRPDGPRPDQHRGPALLQLGRPADAGEPGRRRRTARLPAGRVARCCAGWRWPPTTATPAGTRRSPPARCCGTRRTRPTWSAWTPASRSATMNLDNADADGDRGELAAPARSPSCSPAPPCCCCRSTHATARSASSSAPGKSGFRPFDAYDTEIGMEFATRAAIFIDNARRYSRERATALTLQRSLLPTGLSAPSLGRGPAPLPARQQADRGRRRLVRVDRAARRPGSRWWSAMWPGTVCAPPSPWAGCAPRSRPWPCWSCRPPSRCSSSTS